MEIKVIRKQTMDFREFADKYNLDLVVKEVKEGWEACLQTKDGRPLLVCGSEKIVRDPSPYKAVSLYAEEISGQYFDGDYIFDDMFNCINIPHLIVNNGFMLTIQEHLDANNV